MEERTDIQIIYISTAIYRNYKDGFLSSLQYFAPTMTKHLTILTDDPQDFISYLEEHPEITNYVNKLSIERIVDLPYPCIVLGKFSYVKTFITNDSDYVFYFDADTKFIEKHDDFWYGLFNLMNRGKLLVSPCGIYNRAFHPEIYDEESRKYRIYDVEYCGKYCQEPEDSLLRDKLYIPENSYFWATASFISGCSANVKRFAEAVDEKITQTTRIKKPVAGNAYIDTYIEPVMHDESIVNKLIYDSQAGFDDRFDFNVKPYSCLIPDCAERDFTFICQKFTEHENKKH